MAREKKYFCIHCGHPATDLYKTYAKGKLVKLLDCESCGEHIDKFIEYDPLVVIVSLVLQNELAFRHILLNTEFKVYWKLGIICLLFESYCHWCIAKGIAGQSTTTGFYELELNFYRSLFRCVLGAGLFHSSILFFTFIWFKLRLLVRPIQFSYFALWKGVFLCSFAEVFELFALIWSYTISGPRMDFNSVLLLVSNSQSYKVVTGAPRTLACFTVLTCYLFQKLLYHYFDIYLPVMLTNPRARIT